MNKREMQLLLTLKEEYLYTANALNWTDEPIKEYLYKAQAIDTAINILKKYVQ